LALCISANRAKSRIRAVASGTLFAIALGIKLTPLLLIPGFASEFISGSSVRNTKLNSLSFFGLWIVAAALTLFLALSPTVGSHWPVLFAGHFSSQVQHFATLGGYRFTIVDHLDQLDSFLIVFVLFAAAVSGCTFPLRLPVVILLSVVTAHTFHRPWWYYYWLHFAIPISWLSAQFLVEGINYAYRASATRSCNLLLPLVTIFAVSMHLSLAAFRFRENAKFIADQRNVGRFKSLSIISPLRKDLRWVYSEDLCFPFHASLVPPPPLAVLPLKRFWSGEMTDSKFVQLLRQFRPELVVTFGQPASLEFRDLLRQSYVEIWREYGRVFYLARDARRPNQ
jgi:hypothetical protein